MHHCRCSVLALAAVSLATFACSSEKSSPGKEISGSKSFDPPAPAEGFTRLASPVIEHLEPGADVMYCQYVLEPFDHDVDILAVGGYQSAFGHHVVAFATTSNVPVGTSRRCVGDDNLATTFLGGIGGEGGAGNALPKDVAFRLPKGSGIMLNTHFLNTGTDVIDGESVLDVKFADPDPSRTIAGFFVNIKFGFSLPPKMPSTADTECVLQRDLQFLSFSNHMHDYGTRARTTLLRAAGGEELVHEDPAWSYDMQFNAVYTQWPEATPLVMKKGDSLHTHCEWTNSSSDSVTFPREMCIGVGFYLSDGSPDPMCVNGAWLEGGAAADGGPVLPGPACAEPGATGNETGVGKQCSRNGNECAADAFCLADYTRGDFGDFCSKLCATDADCGTGATCTRTGTSSDICIPSSCTLVTDAGADAATN